MCPSDRFALATSPAQRFPWRSANSFQLLTQGTEFFPDVLQRIDAAKHSVRIELYLVESGRNATKVIDTLCAAAARSVNVEVLLDSVGSKGLVDADRERLTRSGVALRVFNKLLPKPGLDDFKRDHRKIIAIDERTVYLGGACVTDGFWDPVNNVSDWHDLMLRVEGPLVADVVALFDFRWRRMENAGRHPEPSSESRTEPDSQAGWGRLGYTSGVPHRGLVIDLVQRIRFARTRVWLVTPYFFPVKALFDAMLEAAERGVDVQLFLPGCKTDHPSIREAGRGFYTRLFEQGVSIYELDVQTLHAKATIVDEWISVGSCNFDVWGANRNLEANVEAYDADCLEQCLALFDRYRNTCRRVSREEWAARSASERVSQASLNYAGRAVRTLLVHSHLS
ncbi:MAG: phosphatidylserine/phosphatidylglycerophosphate/cardiolipin synthase family protein [Pseudomonas profundi]|uniref:phospholipase D-like domain-containing protein n=1 Tax=Pseudomonas profundi TaxID=1981513 RepID=UPI003000FB05